MFPINYCHIHCTRLSCSVLMKIMYSLLLLLYCSFRASYCMLHCFVCFIWYLPLFVLLSCYYVVYELLPYIHTLSNECVKFVIVSVYGDIQTYFSPQSVSLSFRISLYLSIIYTNLCCVDIV